MNSTQVQTTSATIIGIIAGFLAGRGVFGFDVATWTTILGAVGAVGMAVWTALATRKATIVSQVAAMPEVKSVTLDAGASGSNALAQATPSNVKVG